MGAGKAEICGPGWQTAGARWAGQGPVGLGGGGTGGQGPRKKVPCRWLHIPVDEDPKLLRAPNHFHLGQTSPVGSDI